ncbi:MAG: DegV family protein [Clostridia bacterium]|nr:DegV family protein [Clostridia bacterium]
MKKFVILGDSTCDLNGELRKKYDIDYAPMRFSIDGEDYEADLDYKRLTPHEFYDIMRGGKRIITAQVPAHTFEEKFTEYAKAGEDILYISCSSGLSASINSAKLVADEVMNAYPDCKIVCVDSLCSSMGQGLLCIIASNLRAEDKTIDEVAKFIEENRLKANQECTADKLSYLRQAGRVSAASAFFGGLLNIKPIIISDVKGRNAAIEKVKGRKNSIDKLVERTVKGYEQNPYFSDVCVVHADCPEDADILCEKLLEALPITRENIHIGFIGPIVGASAGPGTISTYFFGKEVTYSAD